MTHEEVVALLSAVDSRSKSNAHRLDEHQRQINDQEKLIATVAQIATKQDAMESTMEEIKTDVKGIRERPARRGEALVDKLVYAFLAALMAYVLARMGIQ